MCNGSEKLDELREKYPKLDNMLSSIEDKLQEVEQAKEEDKESLLKSAEQKIKMFKGYVAEALLKENLKDCFEEISEKEVQQETSQGKTNIDITCREAKEDFKIDYKKLKKNIIKIKKVDNEVINKVKSILITKFENLIITKSVGISIYQNADDNYEMLLKKADRALYEAKKEKNNYVLSV